MSLPPEISSRLIEEIADKGYVVIDDFLPAALISTLSSEAKALHAVGATKKAGIGKAAESSDKVRGDFIHWLEETEASAAQQQYLEHMEALRSELNANLYLGLFEFETHFAVYPPGEGYARHLDQFHGDTQRQVSSILYLNKDWQDDDGGHLRLYLDEASPLDITPLGGRLVIFLSAKFWHEVLPARRERISLTGWFRKRPS
jgi:SM-20-related protein